MGDIARGRPLRAALPKVGRLEGRSKWSACKEANTKVKITNAKVLLHKKAEICHSDSAGLKAAKCRCPLSDS